MAPKQGDELARRTMARRPFLISFSCCSELFWPSGSKGKLSSTPDCRAAGSLHQHLPAAGCKMADAVECGAGPHRETGILVVKRFNNKTMGLAARAGHPTD